MQSGGKFFRGREFQRNPSSGSYLKELEAQILEAESVRQSLSQWRSTNEEEEGPQNLAMTVCPPVPTVRREEVIVVESADGRVHFFNEDGEVLYERGPEHFYLEGRTRELAHELGPREFEAYLHRLELQAGGFREKVVELHRLKQEYDQGRLPPEELERPDELEAVFREKLKQEGTRDIALEFFRLRQDNALIWKTYKEAKRSQSAERRLWEMETKKAVADAEAVIEARTAAALGEMRFKVNEIQKSAKEADDTAVKFITAYNGLFDTFQSVARRALERAEVEAGPQQRENLSRFVGFILNFNVYDSVPWELLRVDDAGVRFEPPEEDGPIVEAEIEEGANPDARAQE